MSNTRTPYRVCQVEMCKDLIAPTEDKLIEFGDNQCTYLIEVCRKCKNRIGKEHEIRARGGHV